MRTTLRFGLVAATACLIVAASVIPADAQRRRSGGGQSAGPQSVAVPRGAQGAGPGAGPRPPQGSGQTAGPRPQGPGPGGGPGGPPPSGQHAVPRPPGGPRPGYGPGHYPGYGRYPYYGYGSHIYIGLGAFYGPYYYSPWFYSPYWGYPYEYGWGYGYGYGWGYPYDAANLKVQVEPKDAEVYVDGHLAGIVDQYDGMFQSLLVASGGHDITIYREGYRSIRQQIYLSVGSTYRIKGVMEKLAPGEPNEPRPQAAPDPQYSNPPPYRAYPPGAQYPNPPQPPDNPPQGAPPSLRAPDAYPPVAGDARFGQVAIRVQPGDAEVLIDGEPWRNQTGADRLVVYLSAGTHRVEIRKDGYDPFVTAVEIKRGETTVLNVSLARF